MTALRKPAQAGVDTGTAQVAAAGLRTFFRLAEAWQLGIAEQTTLLGVARTTLYLWKQGKVGPLDRHQLERLSHLFVTSVRWSGDGGASATHVASALRSSARFLELFW